jgi:hypothetical protein
MKLRHSPYSRPEIVRGEQGTLGAASAWPWEVVPVTKCWMVLGGIPAESAFGDVAICFQYQSLDAGRAERR